MSLKKIFLLFIYIIGIFTISIIIHEQVHQLQYRNYDEKHICFGTSDSWVHIEEKRTGEDNTLTQINKDWTEPEAFFVQGIALILGLIYLIKNKESFKKENKGGI